MSQYKSLYTLTGNINDYNTLLVPRQEIVDTNNTIHELCDRVELLLKAIEKVNK